MLKLQALKMIKQGRGWRIIDYLMGNKKEFAIMLKKYWPFLNIMDVYSIATKGLNIKRRKWFLKFDRNLSQRNLKVERQSETQTQKRKLFICNYKKEKVIMNKHDMEIKEKKKLMERLHVASRTRSDIDLSKFLKSYKLSVIPALCLHQMVACIIKWEIGDFKWALKTSTNNKWRLRHWRKL